MSQAGQSRLWVDAVEKLSGAGDVTLAGNTALYSPMENCVLRKVSDLASAKAGFVGLPNDYTQLM